MIIELLFTILFLIYASIYPLGKAPFSGLHPHPPRRGKDFQHNYQGRLKHCFRESEYGLLFYRTLAKFIEFQLVLVQEFYFLVRNGLNEKMDSKYLPRGQ